MGPEATIPGFFQALAALSEFGGGFALILGLLSPLAMLGIISTMAVAMLKHITKGDAFVGGYELATVYLMFALLILLAGPGKYSIDAILAAKRKAS